MGNNINSFALRRSPRRSGVNSRIDWIPKLAVLLVVAVTSFGVAEESGPGVIIYSTMDHARNEIAIAVPFEKAEKHALVTNVTKADGETFRVTNNQFKQIVRPTDLSRSTVVDEAGLEKLRSEAASIRALQDRYPRAKATLAPLVTSIGNMVQAIGSGNVLVQGKLVPRADYEKQMAASAPKTIDLTVDGRSYSGARLSSFRNGVASIMHSGGVASVEVDQLSDDQIDRLNATSSGALVERPKDVDAVAKQNIAESGSSLENAERTDDSGITAPSDDNEPFDDAMHGDHTEEFAAAKTPKTSTQSDTLVPEEVAPNETVNLGALRPLLFDCRKDLAIIQQGASAMADLESFPGGRFGSMKYDEAMREANVQKARMNEAVETQAILIGKLRNLQTALQETSGLPAEIREHVLDLAETREETLEEFIGIAGLSSEITVLLSRLDAIAPAKATELAAESIGQPAEGASGVNGPGTATVGPAPWSPGEGVEEVAPTESASGFSIGWIAGGSVAVLLLATAAVLIVARSARSMKVSNTGPKFAPAKPPGWLWPTVAGVVATAVVGGLIAMVIKPTPQVDATADEESKLSEITPDPLEPGADETGGITVNHSSPSSAGDFIANPVERTPTGDYDQNAELEQRMRESDRMQSAVFGVSEEEVRQVREAAMETMMKELSR